MVGKVLTGGARPGQQQTGGDPIERISRVGTIAPVSTEPATPDVEIPPVGSSAIGGMLAEEGLIEPTPAAPEPVEPASLTEQELEQRDRERVEPLQDRVEIRDVPFNPDIDDSVIENNPYLGSVARADRLQSVFDSAAEGPTLAVGLTGTVPETDVKRIDALNQGDPEQAFKGLELTASRVLNDPAILDATVADPNTGKRLPDPNFTRIMGLATEAFMVDNGSVAGVDFAEAIDFEDNVDIVGENQSGIKKAKGNARLGRTIWQEWQREKNTQQGLPSDAYIDQDPPSGETAEYIGAMAKEAYALANPDIVERVPAGSQVEFQLKNPEKLRAAQQAANNPFSNNEVPPANAPTPTAQLQFEGKTYTRERVTEVKKQVPGKMKVMEEARQNYHEMPKVVDLKRLGMAVNMAIPALRAMRAQQGQRQPSVWADMLGIGKAKFKSIQGEKDRLGIMVERYTNLASEATNPSQAETYRAKAAAYQEQHANYDVEAIFNSEVDKVLEALNTLARYKNQPNYLTYAIQMLTGRMHVQQTRLNPGANKLVRFVLGQGDRTLIKRGSDSAAERNFKELATLHLDLGGKLIQPQARRQLFDRAMREGRLDRFAEMGRDIRAALDNTKDATDTAVEAIAQIPSATDQIQISPQVSAIQELPLKQATIDYLAEHKTEAPYIMEFLMDFADYHAGRPFNTSLEVEMDGITHGISTNGIALGIQSMAERAGAINYGDTRKLLVDTPATSQVNGLTFNPNGSMTFDVTPEFMAWLEKSYPERRKQSRDAAGVSDAELNKRFGNEVVEWLLQKQGIGQKSNDFLVDYVDPAGIKVDVKLVPKGARKVFSNPGAFNRTDPNKRPEVIEIWETDQHIRKNGIKAGDSITFNPVGRVNAVELHEAGNEYNYTPDQLAAPISLDAQGDIRAGMKDFMLAHGYSIAEEKGYAEKSNAYNDMLVEAIKDRENYLKKSPMTLAYGQEIQNLRQHVEAAVFTGPTSRQIRDIAEANEIDIDEATDYLFEVLQQSLHHALDPRLLEMGQLLRANNTVAMITNEVMTIESPAGFDQYIGARGGTGRQHVSPLSYTTPEGDRKNIGITHYEQEASGSALRPRTSPTGQVSHTPGGWGRGRVIPAAVQGYDGNMIARTGSGKSFDRIKYLARRRGQSGNFQPIFDAFKVSIGMMDVLRDEANKNWIEGLKSKNYFESVDDWARKAMGDWKKKMRELPAGTQLDISPSGEYRGVGWLLDYQNLSTHLGSTLNQEAERQYKKNPTIGKNGQEISFSRHVANEIHKELRAAGILKFNQDPPATLNPRQMLLVVDTITKHMRLNSRNSQMRSDITRDSKKLFSKVNPDNVLQVDLG